MYKIVNDYIVIEVEKIPAEQKTATGIIIPKVAEKPKFQGVVKRTPDVQLFSLNIGETVAYKPNAGIKVNIDGEDLIFLKEEEILAIITV